ncbi:MAG: tetratricopeptide repeat protein, partial [Anaerolineales bacterium]|nr:tetratricopeptide repeat protein [Anaerolineales bacterium]
MSDSKECPFCGEIIAIDAEACAQCGKLLEPGPGGSVGGDQIRLGDLKDVKGVAVGKGAQAVNIEVHGDWIQAQGFDPADKQAAMLPIFEVPFYRNRHFTGRAALLSQLNERRDSGQTAVVTQAIVGLGGVGKTQLALAFSYQHQNSYSLVYWLRSGDRPTLGSDMLVLAQTLKLAQADTDVETGRAVLMRWLAQTKRPWLLVFDNVDTLEPRDMQEFVPKSGPGHVLITSRNPGWSSLAVVLQTDVFTPDEAVTFLLDRTGQTERRAAKKLAKALGHLPLALEHAAAYVNRAGCSLSEYYEMFLTERQALLAEAEIPDAYHATVTTTWELAFKQIQKENQAAIELLNLCCFLAPDEIPLALLTGGAEAGILPEGLSGMLSSKLARNRALAGLQQYSLMRREDEMLFVHRLVQAVAQDRMGAERRQQWANAAVELAAHIFSAVDQNMLHTWEAGPRLLPHALAAAEYAAAGGIKTERAAYLNSWIGFYLQFRADYAGAQPYYEQALAIRQAVLGERHPDTALSLNNLGG